MKHGNRPLFHNINNRRFAIPLLFDSGMGLFENDPYRDEYGTFEEAMHNVYIYQKNNGNNMLDNYWVKFEDFGAECFSDFL